MRILMSVTTWNGARVEAGLRDLGYLTTTAHDAMEVFECLELIDQPVVLLETDLPDMNWRIALTRLRAGNPSMTVIAIDARDQVSDRLAALNAGADDVISPNMRAEEISARIMAVTSRRAGHAGQKLRIGPMKVDLRGRKAYWGPETVTLSRSQYEILELLCLNQDVPVSKDQIMGQLYGIEDGPDQRVLDAFMCKLRAHFADVGAPKDLVETIRGRGFQLNLADAKPETRLVPVDMEADAAVAERKAA